MDTLVASLLNRRVVADPVFCSLLAFNLRVFPLEAGPFPKQIVGIPVWKLKPSFRPLAFRHRPISYVDHMNELFIEHLEEHKSREIPQVAQVAQG
jgi:hypothetical protein